MLLTTLLTAIIGLAQPVKLIAARPAGPKSPQVRPFITDDARVVGKDLGQIET